MEKVPVVNCVLYKSGSRNRIALVTASILTLGALASLPSLAQDGAAPTLPPIPDMSQAEVDTLIREAGFTESEQTVKELVSGWTKPKMMLVRVDRPERIAWLQKAVPDVKLVGIYQAGTIAERQAEALPHAPEADAFDHRRATNIDVFNDGFCIGTFCNSLLKRVEINDHKVYWLNVMIFHCVYVISAITSCEQSTMNFGVKGFNASVHNFWEEGVFGDFFNMTACIF
jgi:hypothetical protein